jgi:hypothetical protein
MSNVIQLHPKKDFSEQYQIVILDCPYNSFQDVETQTLFSKFVAMKLAGYQKEYPYGVLPFGSYDMIATLVMLCEKNADGTFEPIMVFKSTSSERCEAFRLPFEMLELFRNPEAAEHKEATLNILASAKSRGVNVGYNSSWTILSKVRENKELVKLARDVTVMLLNNYYMTYGMKEVLIGGAVRFKVDQLQLFVGWKHLQHENKVLPAIGCPFLFGEQTALMHLTEFSQGAKDMAEQYKSLWENRVVI